MNTELQGNWLPIELDLLIKHIEDDVKSMSVTGRHFWNLLKINPQKWSEEEYGNEGGGFWVVGLIGNQVIWYNDIEEGFNISTYSSFGIIDEYACEQDKLFYTVRKLINNLW